MSSQFSHVTIDEISSLITKGTTPTSIGGKFTKTGIPFVKVESISEAGTLIPEKFAFIDVKTDELLKRSRIQENDVLFSIAGTIGRVALVGSTYRAMNTNQAIALIRPDSNQIDSRFLYFALRDIKRLQTAKSKVVQSVQANFSLGELKKLEIELPSKSEQKAIAHVLGTLDEKIELNRKTNKNLEDIAKALFKSWFVDFDPVRAKVESRSTRLPDEVSELFPDSFEDSELGEIPCEWSICSIGDLLDLERKSINPGDVPEEVFAHYSIPAFDEKMLPSKELGQYIKSNKYLVSEGVFLVSKLNPMFSRIWLPSFSEKQRGICSTEFLVCRTKKSVGISFGYCLSKSQKVIQQMIDLASGTSNSHQRVRPIDFTSITTICPSQPLLNLFTEEVAPFLQKISQLLEQNLILSNCRDVLLPKLISGELRIPDAEKMLDEVGI